MRLGVDARVLVHRPTGVARYLAGLMTQWPDFKRPDDRLVYYVDRSPEQPLTPPPDELRVARTRLPGGDPVWRQWSLRRAIRRDPPDLLFCPFYSAPLLTEVPTVVTVHDVSFASHPEWFRLKSRLAFAISGPSARRARRVLTVSHFSAKEIVEYLNVPAERVSVIPPGISPVMSQAPTADEVAAMRAWLHWDGPYFLHLGAVHQRRHVDSLVRAFARLAPRRRDLGLVITGPTIQPAPDLAQMVTEEFRLKTQVIRREWVPEEHLRALVAGATALVYLSSYEGFGLPCLEAMASGTPVIAMPIASLPEVLGDAALWVPSHEPEKVARAMESILNDTVLPRQLSELGRSRAALFDWRVSAERTFDLFREIAGG